MPDEQIDDLIIGAGVGGLVAANHLARAGRTPHVIERGNAAGGLMRSFEHGDFIIDIGRKELLDRLTDVDAIWTAALDGDYLPYPRRCGVLYQGRIFETDREWGGLRYGMPLGMFTAGVADLLTGMLRGRPALPTYESETYRRRGRRFSQVFYQGYEEKISGMRWVERPLATSNGTDDEGDRGGGGGLVGRVRALAARALRTNPQGVNWRHPRRGAGQICTALEQLALEAGAEFTFKCELKRIEPRDGALLVHVEQDGAARTLACTHVLSSLLPDISVRLLGLDLPPEPEAKGVERRSTILVYVFLDHGPRLPHTWLKVTCPDTQAARITNYAAWSPDMVPDGKCCLCIEYCCIGDDPMLKESDEHMRDLALRECAAANLADPSKCFDHLVRRLPGVDGATDLDDWWSPRRRDIRRQINAIPGMFCTCQPGTDYASLGGLRAAEAIVSGDHAGFDRATDPDRLFGAVEG